MKKKDPSLIKTCAKCGKALSKNNKGGFCNSCRDRTGANNSFFGKTHSSATKEKLRQGCAISSKKKWENEDYRQRVIKAVSKPRRAGFASEQSKRISQWYIDHPEQRDIRAVTMKRTWEENKIVPVMPGASYNESKGEKLLYAMLFEKYGEQVTRKHYIKNESDEYLGRYMIPDCILLGFDVIEYYGNYWHANPSKYSALDIIHHGITAQEIWEKDKRRVEALEDSGYRVHIVWESDFKKNRTAVLESLCNAIDWDSCGL